MSTNVSQATKVDEKSQKNFIYLDILNVYLIDVVSGSIVFTMNHKRVKGPIKIVHSENWLVYTFYNEKIRRNEICEFFFYELLFFSQRVQLEIRKLQ